MSSYPLFLEFEEFRCRICDEICESGTVLVSKAGNCVFMCEKCIEPVKMYRDEIYRKDDAVQK